MSTLGRSMILASAEALTAAASTTFSVHKLGLGDWATEVTFYIDVQSVTGSGSLTAKVQGVLPHTTGNQYMTERVFDLDAVQKVNLTAEAEDWPNPVCTDASSFPLTVQRTYIGFGCDLRLVLTTTSTLAPTVTVVAHAKG